MTAADFVSRLAGVRKTGDGWMACCPAHDDSNPSMSVTEKGGKVLVHCHAGCPTESIVGALGLKLSDLMPDAVKPQIVAEYVYTDADGKPLFGAVRYEPKTFKQFRIGDHGEKVWKMAGVDFVPYHLPDVGRAVREGKTIWVVEGEKDADNLAKLGFVSTCNIGGAGKWRDCYSKHLAGARRVIIIADNDSADKDYPGQRHAVKVAESLKKVGVEASVIVLPDGIKDASDFIAVGHGADDFRKLADNPPPFAPPWDPVDGFVELFGRAKRVGAFADPIPDEGNPNAIFKDKYLRRGQMMMLVSTLGIGKSTWCSQGSECWALGREFLGVVPCRPLSIGVFETEDDDEEVADFRNNFRRGFLKAGWSELEVGSAESGDNAPVYYPLDGVGTNRFLEYLEYCVSRKHHDLIIINPAYDFIDGDFSKAEDVREWKARLLSLAVRYGFAVLLVHHTNKVPTNAKERDQWCTGTSAAYAGSGSMVLPSSARAVIFIRPVEKKEGLFEMCAAKRGKRLGWRDAEGKSTIIKHIAHTEGMIFWREASADEVSAVVKNRSAEKKLPVGVERVINICKDNGSPFESVSALYAALGDRYDNSTESFRQWLNAAVDSGEIVKHPIKGTQKVMVGLRSAFWETDDE